MSRYEVAPFKMTPDFVTVWSAADADLNLRVCGACSLHEADPSMRL